MACLLLNFRLVSAAMLQHGGLITYRLALLLLLLLLCHSPWHDRHI